MSAANIAPQQAAAAFANFRGLGEPLHAWADKSIPMTDAANSATYGANLSFPKRRNTVRAEVLTDLLTRRRMRSLNAVFASSTTRLAAVIHVLGDTQRGKYGWPIKRCDVDVKTSDGRTATVTES